MAETILITGASSGIGKTTVKLFHQRLEWFDFANDDKIEKYQTTVQGIQKLTGIYAENPSAPEVVADAIWTAVTDGTNTLRYRTGKDAVKLLDNRKALDNAAFIGDMKEKMGR